MNKGKPGALLIFLVLALDEEEVVSLDQAAGLVRIVSLLTALIPGLKMLLGTVLLPLLDMASV